MAQRHWNRVRRNKAKDIAAEGYARAGEETKKFLAKLDAVKQEWEAASPAEREVIRRRIIGEVEQG